MRSLFGTMRWTLCVAALVTCAASAGAGPLRETDLPPDTELVIHLDWDAARGGAAFRQLAEQATAGLIESGFVGSLAAELVADSNLHDLTLVVTAGGTFQVVRADTDVDGLREIFADAPGYCVVKHGQYEIHHWLDLPAALKSTDEANNSDDPSPIYAAVCGDGTFFLSKQLRPVVEALERRDGASEKISTEKLAAICDGCPNNTVLLIHASSGQSLETIGLPLKTGRATVSYTGNVCECVCEAELPNSAIASAIANTLRPENVVSFVQSFAAGQADADSATKPEDEEGEETGQRNLNLGFGFKNIDAETMHDMIANAFSTTTDGAKIRFAFRGVIEPNVKIDAKNLAISLVIDGAKTSTAAKEETIR